MFKKFFSKENDSTVVNDLKEIFSTSGKVFLGAFGVVSAILLPNVLGPVYLGYGIYRYTKKHNERLDDVKLDDNTDTVVEVKNEEEKAKKIEELEKKQKRIDLKKCLFYNSSRLARTVGIASCALGLFSTPILLGGVAATGLYAVLGKMDEESRKEQLEIETKIKNVKIKTSDNNTNNESAPVQNEDNNTIKKSKKKKKKKKKNKDKNKTQNNTNDNGSVNTNNNANNTNNNSNSNNNSNNNNTNSSNNSNSNNNNANSSNNSNANNTNNNKNDKYKYIKNNDNLYNKQKKYDTANVRTFNDGSRVENPTYEEAIDLYLDYLSSNSNGNDSVKVLRK